MGQFDSDGRLRNIKETISFRIFALLTGAFGNRDPKPDEALRQLILLIIENELDVIEYVEYK